MGWFNKTKPRTWGIAGRKLTPKEIAEQAELKGEVQKKENKFDKELGEEHPFEFATTEGLYAKFGLVTGVVDKIIDFTWGPGFFTESDDEKAKEIIDQWMEDVDFSFHGRKWFREALVKGTGFLELGGKENEMPQGVKVLDAKRMFIERNKKGKIIKVNQVSMSKGVKAKPIPFQPFQMAILPINQIGDNVYGNGLIFPALEGIELLLRSQKDLHELISRKANAPLWAKIGDKEKDILPKQSELDSFGQLMTFMNNKTEWATAADVELSVIDFGDIGGKYSEVLSHDLDMLFFTFQVPEVLMGRGNIPEGLAKVQLEAFDRRIRSFQAELEKVIEQKIFRRVLQANGNDSHVEFNWGQPGKSEVNAEIDKISTLLGNPMIGPELRFELEKRLASLLDIPEDKIEPPEEQREREEEEEQPRVPGQNESGEYEFHEGTLCDH